MNIETFEQFIADYKVGAEKDENQYRTNLCAEVNESTSDKDLTLSGWVNKEAWDNCVELRDVSGIMQCH